MKRSPLHRFTAMLAAALFILGWSAAWGQESVSPVKAPPVPGPISGDGKINVATEVDRVVIRAGEIVQYSMSVSAPEGYKIAMPQPGAQLGSFIIRDYNFPGAEEESGLADRLSGLLERLTGSRLGTDTKEQKFEYTITSYETGDQLIPPVPLAVISPEGKKHILFAESARIRVVAVTSPEDLTIKDLHAPIEIEIPVQVWLPWVLIPLIALILIVGAIVYLRRPREEETEEVDLRPAHVIALEELAKLEGEELLEKGEYGEFYTRLSHIFRKYLSLRYRMYALEYTTSEIAEKMKSTDIERADYEQACSFLHEADQVKFASYEPLIDQRSTAIKRVREMVYSTREHLLEEEEKEAA